MGSMERAATSWTLSQEWGLFAKLQMSARTVRRRLQQHGLSARKLWLRLPLKRHHSQKRLQRWDQRRIWAHEWQDVVFSEESVYIFKRVASVFGGIPVSAHSYWPITLWDGIVCYWQHVSVTSCLR
ncbi:hypothetical protein TNCV_838031 [Trichonephila clavipes]|nr:hypothetical protein TNCV_838031 [Trichonephila clavipes]